MQVANVEGTIVENQPPTQLEEEKSDYILASSVNVNKLAESEVKEAEKEQKLKKENAVKVLIFTAILLLIIIIIFSVSKKKISLCLRSYLMQFLKVN